MGPISEVLGIVGFIAVVGWILRGWFSHRRALKLAAMQAELQAKVLDKFGTAPEVIEYMQRAGGQGLLQTPAVEKSHPYQRIMGAVQAGVILALVGGAALFLRNQISDGYEGFVFLGSVGLALGLGFLISAVVAFLLSKHWGLINGEKGTND